MPLKTQEELKGRTLISKKIVNKEKVIIEAANINIDTHIVPPLRAAVHIMNWGLVVCLSKTALALHPWKASDLARAYACFLIVLARKALL